MADPLQSPQVFEFFQAMRLFERGAVDGVRGRPVGEDHEPRHEVARLRASPRLGFPASAILSAERRVHAVAGGARAVDLQISFMGALGAGAVLPWSYSEFVLDRLSRRDRSLLDFVDTLHHRSLSFFYRAWKKYRLPIAYESAQQRGETDDLSTALASLVGLGTPHLEDAPQEGADRWRHFAGLFARGARTALGLEGMLEAVTGYPVQVQEFVGRWQSLVDEERTRLGGRPLGAVGVSQTSPNVLGDSAILGERVWDVLSGVRIRIGPVAARGVADLTRQDGRTPWLGSLVRSYLGAGIDFEIVCFVDSASVTPGRLGEHCGLGQSFWLGARDSGSYQADVPLDVGDSASADHHL